MINSCHANRQYTWANNGSIHWFLSPKEKRNVNSDTIKAVHESSVPKRKSVLHTAVGPTGPTGIARQWYHAIRTCLLQALRVSHYNSLRTIGSKKSSPAAEEVQKLYFRSVGTKDAAGGYLHLHDICQHFDVGIRICILTSAPALTSQRTQSARAKFKAEPNLSITLSPMWTSAAVWQCWNHLNTTFHPLEWWKGWKGAVSKL